MVNGWRNAYTHTHTHTVNFQIFILHYIFFPAAFAAAAAAAVIVVVVVVREEAFSKSFSSTDKSRDEWQTVMMFARR